MNPIGMGVGAGIGGALGSLAFPENRQRAQEFLNHRVEQLKRGFTTPDGAADMAPLAVPNIGGKLGTKVGIDILKSAGTPGAAQMSLLGGNAPIYDNPFN